MQWKTDWNGTDIYSPADAERLFSNYNELKELLISVAGFVLDFTLPEITGYATIFADDELNEIEAALHQLRVWDVDWLPPPPPWVAGGNVPSFEDINRWEQNAQTIERIVQLVAVSFFYSGEVFSGEI